MNKSANFRLKKNADLRPERTTKKRKKRQFENSDLNNYCDLKIGTIVYSLPIESRGGCTDERATGFPITQQQCKEKIRVRRRCNESVESHTEGRETVQVSWRCKFHGALSLV